MRLLFAYLVLSIAACTIQISESEVPPPVIDSVYPTSSRAGDAQVVDIYGSGFTPDVHQDLGAEGGVVVNDEFIPVTLFSDIRYVTDERLEARVRDDLCPDTYDVEIVTPRGEAATLPDAYRITGLD